MKRIDFDTFRDEVESAGFEAVRRSSDHWQIVGGPLRVNFYPNAKKGSTTYVNGTNHGRRASVEDAIQMASCPPPTHPTKKSQRPANRMRKVLNRLFRKDPHCHWCGIETNRIHMDPKQATVDHKIPLFRGGSNGNDNLVLACRKCNAERGHAMPELKAEPTP